MLRRTLLLGAVLAIGTMLASPTPSYAWGHHGGGWGYRGRGYGRGYGFYGGPVVVGPRCWWNAYGVRVCRYY